jgi:hypothetical protein
MMTTGRIVPSADAIRRQNELFDLYSSWPDAAPEDDPEFVAQAQEIMGLPPLPAGLG